MGHPKHKWSPAEEEALRRGVDRYGAGKWKNIHQDPEFGPALRSRSNIDLKDKWRNLGVASGQIKKENSKSKAKNAGKSAVVSQTPASVNPMFVASSATSESLNAPDQAQMMHEPNSSTLEQPNGSDSGAVTDFKEIKNLIHTIKTEEQPETSNPPPSTATSREEASDHAIRDFKSTMERAHLWVAGKVAEAENRWLVAAESMREAERIAAMAEESEALLQFAEECVDASAHGNVLIRKGTKT